MRWPWSPKHSGCEQRRAEHEARMTEARAGLDETRAHWGEVRDVAGRVDRLRRENGFAEAVRVALAGRP